jgi:hypothetical protein
MAHHAAPRHPKATHHLPPPGLAARSNNPNFVQNFTQNNPNFVQKNKQNNPNFVQNKLQFYYYQCFIEKL